LALSWGP